VTFCAVDPRRAFYLKDAERADFFSVSAPRSAEGAFALEHVRDLRIGGSRATPDVTLGSIENRTL
jgi:hypothetical protein